MIGTRVGFTGTCVGSAGLFRYQHVGIVGGLEQREGPMRRGSRMVEYKLKCVTRLFILLNVNSIHLVLKFEFQCVNLFYTKQGPSGTVYNNYLHNITYTWPPGHPQITMFPVRRVSQKNGHLVGWVGNLFFRH